LINDRVIVICVEAWSPFRRQFYKEFSRRQGIHVKSKGRFLSLK